MTIQKERLRHYLAEYLQQRGLSLTRPFRCLNPNHEDKHPSMSYYERADHVHCFSCRATYDIFDLIGMDYGLSAFSDKVEKACHIFGMEAPSLHYETVEPIPKKSNCSIDLTDRSAELAQLEHRSVMGEYFAARGITEDSCRRFRLFEADGRAFFPVLEGGRCTGWCARSVKEGVEPRYLNSTGPMGLWNGDLLTEEGKGRRLFITEGIIDAICLEQLGKCAIALCGSQNVSKLIRRCEADLRRANGWRFVACGDPDKAGHAMNEALRKGFAGLEIPCDILPLEEGDGDIAALYQNNQARLRLLLTVQAVPVPGYTALSAAAGLPAFFTEVARRSVLSAASTGFSGLDRLLDGGLYSGLYVLGAISSLGKTSLALQIADCIAAHDGDVLYFSLEQSRFELMAKSLSRVSAQLDAGRKNAFTARQMMTGRYRDSRVRQQLLEDVRQSYASGAECLFLREGVADIGAQEIRRAVAEHVEQGRRAPTVIVDYLQILRPADPRATDKQNTDRAVVELKRLSRDFDIPVLAISSFNRENYRAAVSMEAFKESGAVEYSSDVLLGLQLQGAGEKGFDSDRAKSKEPRQLELVMLKNRNGIPFAKLPLRYYAKFNLFEENV